MIIKDDTIEFEAADVQQLSAGLQKALARHVGPRALPEEALTKAVAAVLTIVKKQEAARIGDGLQKLVEALVVADDSKKDQVQVFIDQAKVAAGVPVTPVVKFIP